MTMTVVLFVTKQGCQISIQGQSAKTKLEPLGNNGNQVAVQSGAPALRLGLNDVPAGVYHVQGSSAFNAVGDGVIIVYDAEDPPVPVPFALLGFTDAKKLNNALYHYVASLQKKTPAHGFSPGHDGDSGG